MGGKALNQDFGTTAVVSIEWNWETKGEKEFEAFLLLLLHASLTEGRMKQIKVHVDDELSQTIESLLPHM